MTPPDPYRRARRSDPETSHEAARQVEATGMAQAQAHRVFDAVVRWPERTSAELAMNMQTAWRIEWPNIRYAVARRLPELLAAGLVERGEPRQCQATGRRAMTWQVVKK